MADDAKTLARNLAELVKRGEGAAGLQELTGDESLPELLARAGIGAASGIGRLSRIGDSGGGGIASPLTEDDYAERTWHAEYAFTTTDAVFTFSVEPLASIKLTDANGRPVSIIFDAP